MSHTKSRYLESVENHEGDVFDVFRVAVPRSVTTLYAGLSLASESAPSAADSRVVARAVAEEVQTAVTSGRLVLPS